MEMREFDSAAWNCFAGSVEWTGEHTLPLIGESTFDDGTRYCLVLDATGGCLIVEDDPVNEQGGYCLALPFPNQAAARAFAAGLGTPRHKLDFLLLGFLPA